MELLQTTEFTPVYSLIGGVLIGLSSVLVMALFGRVTGISGITGDVLKRFTGEGSAAGNEWKLPFLAGLIAAPLLYALTTGALPAQTVPTSLLGMGAAGLIVGVGTALGSGCTSGHGVCGLARLSPRSLFAVLPFMSTGALTVFVLRHVV